MTSGGGVSLYSNPDIVTHPIPPTPPSSYSLPGSYSTVSTGVQLVSQLAGSPSGGNIVLVNGSYDTGGGYFSNPNGYDLYAQNPPVGGVPNVTLVAGIQSNASSPKYQGIKWDVSDLSRCFSIGGTTVCVSHWGGSAQVVLDCSFDGHNLVNYGIWDQSPAGLIVQRIVGKNFQDGLLRYDNNSSQPYSPTNAGTPVVSTITDIDSDTVCRTSALASSVNASVTTIPLTSSVTTAGALVIGTEVMLITGGLGSANPTVTRGALGTTAAAHSAGALVFTPYDSNGTAEAALISGHPASNPVARIRSYNAVTCHLLTLLNSWNTTFADLNFDSSGLQVKSVGTGVGIYNEHYSQHCLFRDFKMSAMRLGVNSEWDGGTPGNAGGHFNTYQNGVVDANGWGGGGHSAGFYFDQGTESPTVTACAMYGQNWAGIGNYLGTGTPVYSGNIYPGGAVPDTTTSHI